MFCNLITLRTNLISVAGVRDGCATVLKKIHVLHWVVFLRNVFYVCVIVFDLNVPKTCTSQLLTRMQGLGGMAVFVTFIIFDDLSSL
jgi:hypothetical protein